MMIEESLKNETNTTDATTGQSLRARVAARKAELEAAVASPDTDERTRRDLLTALAPLDGLLTGNLDEIPRVVAASLSAWLESNKHLNERHDGPGSASPVAEACEPGTSTASTVPVAGATASTVPVAGACEPGTSAVPPIAVQPIAVPPIAMQPIAGECKPSDIPEPPMVS
jgi:hypothetical protein